jgi:SAM-dependent methyltransferase
MSVHDHYDKLLGPVYSWMVGGADAAIERGAAELERLRLTPGGSGLAIDLGAGFGAHAIPLARLGFRVLAIDSCASLLAELDARKGPLPVQTIHADLESFSEHSSTEPAVVLCMGDTLTHLADAESVIRLIRELSATLGAGGRFVTSFRDYSTPLIGQHRFIPVRSDERRILTCFLEYAESHVTVHDLLHERNGDGWTLRVSAYRKLRISAQWFAEALQKHCFSVEQGHSPSGMISTVATRTERAR